MFAYESVPDSYLSCEGHFLRPYDELLLNICPERGAFYLSWFVLTVSFLKSNLECSLVY